MKPPVVSLPILVLRSKIYILLSAAKLILDTITTKISSIQSLTVTRQDKCVESRQ
jgi:hypothetical protein